MLVSVQVVAAATIHDVFMALLDGSLDQHQRSYLPICRTDNHCQAFVWKSQSGPFQTVIITAQVGELCDVFGRFLTVLPS